ncbi:DUF4157 domain-containing protein [Saccharopolyspora dendranthemae]|uniref:Uncharacterized protein DUF4157 n=1 Tax=Saccharopolyspora dendranthemae TaxID=1181886 RepID=A0A561V7U3_9PSEU|nr:DUF4157 domain-containing protein [Saccharopolyspora dendranthemae]TWG07674.1 uncharacterized protein DUF4157 [Saccharopolyspora dendranthemae]
MRQNDQREPESTERRTTPPVTAAHQAMAARAGTLLGPGALLDLQRTVGNTVAAGMIARRRDDAVQEYSVQRSEVEQELRRPGHPLDHAVRSEMETRLGADFSEVRVHTGPSAHTAAESVRARALTTGSHIVFQNGHYNTTAAGKHTLAHELTHVLQQRSGPVPGADRGDGVTVSDPSDACERAAEASADRVMRTSAPVQRTHAESVGTSARTAPNTVQRSAWVDGTRVDPADSGLSSEMKELAGDQDIRAYKSDDEFREHADKKTDYLGNLTDGDFEGTWVRFHPDRVNVLGEKHGFITLPDVLRAVRSSSFIYEAFTTDDLTKQPNTKNAYLAELGPVLENFHGIDLNSTSDYWQHGAEPLDPKLGEAMSLLIPRLRQPAELEKLTSEGEDSHFGHVAQRFLKITWQRSRDSQSRGKPGTKTDLSRSYTRAKKQKGFDEFVTKLPVGGHIGDAFNGLDKKERRKYAELLADYLEDFVKEVVQSKSMTPEEAAPELKRRRDEHLGYTVEQAAMNGVRYVGMGWDHYNELEKLLGDDSRFNFVDMAKSSGLDGLSQFISETSLLRSEAGG